MSMMVSKLCGTLFGLLVLLMVGNAMEDNNEKAGDVTQGYIEITFDDLGVEKTTDTLSMVNEIDEDFEIINLNEKVENDIPWNNSEYVTQIQQKIDDETRGLRDVKNFLTSYEVIKNRIEDYTDKCKSETTKYFIPHVEKTLRLPKADDTDPDFMYFWSGVGTFGSTQTIKYVDYFYPRTRITYRLSQEILYVRVAKSYVDRSFRPLSKPMYEYIHIPYVPPLFLGTHPDGSSTFLRVDQISAFTFIRYDGVKAPDDIESNFYVAWGIQPFQCKIRVQVDGQDYHLLKNFQLQKCNNEALGLQEFIDTKKKIENYLHQESNKITDYGSYFYHYQYIREQIALYHQNLLNPNFYIGMDPPKFDLQTYFPKSRFIYINAVVKLFEGNTGCTTQEFTLTYDLCTHTLFVPWTILRERSTLSKNSPYRKIKEFQINVPPLLLHTGRSKFPGSSFLRVDQITLLTFHYQDGVNPPSGGLTVDPPDHKLHCNITLKNNGHDYHLDEKSN